MKEAGMTTEAAVAQSKGAYHQTEASLADLKRQVRETDVYKRQVQCILKKVRLTL